MTRKGIGGPKTPEGKRRSSLNALKHGLHAQSPQAVELLCSFSVMSPDNIRRNMLRKYLPSTQSQVHVVRIMTDFALEFARTEALERRLRALKPQLSDSSAARLALSEHKRILIVHFRRAATELNRLKSRRSVKSRKTNSGAPF